MSLAAPWAKKLCAHTAREKFVNGQPVMAGSSYSAGGDGWWCGVSACRREGGGGGGRENPA